MGVIQDRMADAMADKLKDVLLNIQNQAEKTNKEVIDLMTQIKELLKEIQLCTNNNFVWTMNTEQLMCDKMGIKHPDPMEKTGVWKQ